MGEMSYQVLAGELRLFWAQAWPGLALAVYTLALVSLTRFWARYAQQKRIVEYLPQVVRDEIAERERRIAALEAQLGEERRAREAAVTCLRAVGNRAAQTQALVAEHLPATRLRLAEPKEARG